MASLEEDRAGYYLGTTPEELRQWADELEKKVGGVFVINLALTSYGDVRSLTVSMFEPSR
jgi:hypothetical protein